MPKYELHYVHVHANELHACTFHIHVCKTHVVKTLACSLGLRARLCYIITYKVILACKKGFICMYIHIHVHVCTCIGYTLGSQCIPGIYPRWYKPAQLHVVL